MKKTRWMMVLAVAALTTSCGTKSDPMRVDSGSDNPGSDMSGTTDVGGALDSSQPRDTGSTDVGGGPDRDAAGSEDAAGGNDAATPDVGVDGGAGDSGGTDAPDPCTEPFTTISNPGAPPFSGTAFVTNELITENDPTAFVDLVSSGTGMRTVFDRRVNAFVTQNMHLFDAQFGTNTNIEIQVNTEFSATDAETEARYYATSIGRIPAFLFRDLDTVTIHRGMNPFGGGNRNLLIHTEQGESYANGGSLEEIFIHEASHTSMDSYHGTATRWSEAKSADGVALSTYARDNPTREDVAETVGPYLAVRYRRSRISSTTAETIEQTVPNRLQYFDCVGIDMAIVQ